MPQDRTLKAIKTRSRSEQVSVISLLFLPLLGLCCLLLPEESTMALPFVLGGIMAVSGIGGIVHAAAGAKRDEGDGDERERAAEHAILGKAIVMSVLGIVILVQGHASISFVGVMWGLLGLYKAADEIDEVVHALRNRRPFVLKLAFTVFEMVLAVLLIISPFANIEHHVLLLGLELIAYPFRIESGDSGKLTIETEA
ncbi:DUF308 domain-containing protein [Eggerthella guodeyinii]|uniref:DUF308 domain-containing protein n=1 Tax=Eggerthella guodeyinii TaxID=2690837 RepID=A0A6N7RJD6_9ACTN|nr:DUF308 domain-containing protein [Eggerthella guodeyinii]MRX81423.1 hypothetical protein [Eggerthella guodeyinii]